MASRSTLPEDKKDAVVRALAEMCDLPEFRNANGKPNQTTIGDRLGFTQQQISRALKKKFGPEFADAVARWKGFEDVGQLVRHYRGDEPTPARVVELDARYPERSAAIAAAVTLGETEADARRWADEAAVALDADEDPDRGWWLRRLLARRDESRKLAASLPAQEAAAAKSEADTAAAVARTRPKLPKKRGTR